MAFDGATLRSVPADLVEAPVRTGCLWTEGDRVLALVPINDDEEEGDEDAPWFVVWDALDRQDWRRKRIAKDSKHFHAYARPVTDGSYSRDTHPTYGNNVRYEVGRYGGRCEKVSTENDPKLLKRNSLLRWVPGKVTSFSPAYKTWSVELLGRDRQCRGVSSDRIAALSSDKSPTFFASTGSRLLELPPKTERRLEVVPNEEEKAAYTRLEAIARRRAAELLRGPKPTSKMLSLHA